MTRARILRVIVMVIFLLAFAAILLVPVPNQTATEHTVARIYPSEAIAHEHCATPMQVAGPVNGPPRGWRCPPA